MKKELDAFTSFCRAMGDDNDNCIVCPLQGICNEMPTSLSNEFSTERDFREAKAAWRAEANKLAEKAADLFNVTI